MKELGITKGDLISEQAEYIYREIGEGYGFNGPEDLALEIIQDKLDNYSEEQNSQLLERYNEAIKVLENIKNVIKHHTHNITDENQNQWEVVEVSDIEDELEQTISKAKGE